MSGADATPQGSLPALPPESGAPGQGEAKSSSAADLPPGICVSILHTGKAVRLTAQTPADFLTTIAKANVSWVNFGVDELAGDGEFVASLLGFSSSLVSLLCRAGPSAYEDLDSELGLRLPVVRVRGMQVEVFPLLVFVRKGLVLTVHERGKVVRMAKFARYADTFMRKIPHDAPMQDKLTLLLIRILNENNDRNFDGLRTLEDAGERLAAFLLNPEGKASDLGRQVYEMKSALIAYLDTLWASLDVIQNLRYGDAELISDDDQILGRVGILADDITRQISLSEHMSEVLASGLEVLQSIYNNQLQKLNNKLALFVGVLTLLGTAVLVPNTLATAIGAMPGGWPYGNDAYWGLMLASTVVSTGVAWYWVRRRGWIPDVE